MNRLTPLHTAGRKAERGQIFVVLAVALLALAPMVGVVLDGGNLYLQRRTAQTSADAASLAGTRELSKLTAAGANTTIAAAVCQFAFANEIGVTPSITTAYLVGTDGTTNVGAIDLTNCTTSPGSTTVPDTASGVHVEVAIGPVPTKLLGMVGIANLNVSGIATAQVGNVNEYNATNSPFIVCGFATTAVSDSSGTTAGVTGTHPDLLLGSAGSYTLNAAYVGWTFRIHGPTSPPTAVSSCGAGTSFKGLALQNSNPEAAGLPADLFYWGGTQAGPTSVQVQTTNGCAPPNNTNCVMILPIASGLTPGNSSTMRAEVWAPFYITAPTANSHNGQLLSGAYAFASAPKTYSWTVGDAGLVAIGITR